VEVPDDTSMALDNNESSTSGMESSPAPSPAASTRVKSNYDYVSRSTLITQFLNSMGTYQILTTLG